MSKKLAAILAQIALIACSTPGGSSSQSKDVALGWGNSDDRSPVISKPVGQSNPVGLAPVEGAPSWAKDVPRDGQVLYFAGDARGEDKDDALERAWLSALLRVGMAEFPELTRLKSKSRESLRDTSYERSAVTDLQLINWAGVSEAREQGSPAIVFDERTNTYSVYRLLCWKRADVERARAGIREATAQRSKDPARYEIPDTPEDQAGREEDAITALQKMKRVTREIEKKDCR